MDSGSVAAIYVGRLKIVPFMAESSKGHLRMITSLPFGATKHSACHTPATAGRVGLL